MSKPKEYVMILWEDPTSEWDGWQDIQKLAATKVTEVFSVGWPVREDDTHVYLSMDWSDESCHTVGKIPKSAIKARKLVKMKNFPPRIKPAGVPKMVQKEVNDVQE